MIRFPSINPIGRESNQFIPLRMPASFTLFNEKICLQRSSAFSI
jgi:hypothetical protein